VSCFPELSYSVYVDGELPEQDARALELHLVQCRRCRELVVALREEADLVAGVLAERWREPAAPAAAAPAPVRGMALGFAPVLAAAALLSAVLGSAIEGLRPAGLDWIDPWSLRGVSDMLFDLVFVLRDRAPAAFEVAVAAAAMASVSALLTFALTVLLRRWSGPRLLLFGLLAALLAPAAPSRAHFGLHEHRDYELAAGEVHDGTLVVSGRNVRIDGRISGDLVTFTERLTIRGEVDGNVFAAARNAEIPGRVSGSLHVVGGRVGVYGEVGGNLYAAAETLSVGGSGRVQRDAALAGESVVVEGQVGRDLYLAGDTTELRGRVSRALRAWAQSLELLDGAEVGGDIDVHLPEGVELRVAPDARVGGETRRHLQVHHHEPGIERFLEARTWLWLALHVAAGFAVGMLLYALLPGLFEQRLETPGAFLRSLGTGFVAAVAAPVALVLLALTIVGLPLALMGLAAFAAALYVSGIVVAALVGRAIVRGGEGGLGAFGLALLAGLAPLVLASHAPFLGPLVRGIVVLTGLGLLVERTRRAWRASRRPA
jgi:cytoskeletal protein CcmA (bactofilin family)